MVTNSPKRLWLPVRARGIGLSAGIGLLLAMPEMAFSQSTRPSTPPASTLATDPKLSAAQMAFEALPEAERKTIQSDLVWAGNFTGGNSGGFGPLTFRAINAFKSKSGAVTDGMLSVADRKALAAAARVAREQVGFQVATDARAGLRIGMPQAILPKRDVTPSGGSRWQSLDGRITLDTRSGQKGDTLQSLFDKATASTVPGRRITYKLLRPDFYVISGETASGKFYSRMATGPDGVRGFSVGYDKALAESFDPLVIAIANSLEAFPAAASPAPAQVASVPNPAAQARLPSAPAVVAPTDVVRVRDRHGAGVVVAGGTVLTAASAVSGCRALKAGTLNARVKLGDDAVGLALLEVEGIGAGSAARLAKTDLASLDDVVVIAAGEGGSRAMTAFPGTIAGPQQGALFAPLQPGGAGSAIYDRQGGLAGLALANPAERYLVAGVVPPRAHPMAGTGAVAGFLRKANVPFTFSDADKRLTTGALAQMALTQVVTITCMP